ncbi:formate dehydrogenase accessory sulfurtransferase FdhD [Corynebacterium otitidis]|uniref:Sulfur carrier protein FdhD n=1 Tax=Corynebacterium otitidis ATCC 51513 TaxID=883169 RepID=I7IXZ4_9CORY|nr:formate dehydrogenase accessory sulfurtransferase FdhD [Corynebacterium otitidis]EJZ81498.1 formate dehydrogenase family accessory protein FdhD [Corynebacterium otitidis ATCC 51513]CCI84158.1 FdhD protein [Corynebacterium otitidis ATCC 51513]
MRITPTVPVTKVRITDDGDVTTDTRADAVAGEEPLEIHVGGQTLTTTMRTPGNDIELAHGFLYSEGLIDKAEDLAEARYCAGATDGYNSYNVLDLELASRQPLPPEFIRPVETTSACGVCGSTSIERVLDRRRPEIEPLPLDPGFVVSLPERLRAHQKAFRRTGGIHAAAAVNQDGEVLVAREDIGRHNAVDKVVGSLMLDGALPATGMILVVSSRASFELVQKAVSAGFSALVAVSAASSMAVELARGAGLALAGFTRPGRFNLYSGELAESAARADAASPDRTPARG